MTPTSRGHTEAAGGESRQRWTVSPSWTASPANRLVAKLLLGHCTNRRPPSALTWQTETSRRRSATPKSPSPMTKDDIEIWTDGSVQEGNQNGGGAAIITTKLTSTTLKSAAGAVASSYEAEMEAIKIALEYVSTLGQEHGTSVRIMTDSLLAQQTSDRPRGPGHQLRHHHMEGG